MKSLIQHALADHPEEILKHSLKNCHVRGMHSLMLETSWRKIRMFYTTPEHELWRNTPENYHEGLSVWFHPHHCNISLAPLVGEILNWGIEEAAQWDILLDRYKFTSHINSWKWGFEKLQAWVKLTTTKILEVSSGESIFLSAQEMHTVWVQRWEEVAWMVLEGKENQHHDDKCYSNSSLESWSPEWLYTPFADIEEIREALVHLWVL